MAKLGSSMMFSVAPAQVSVFGRVLAGVDGSPEGIEAARQAVRLTEPGGKVTLVAAWMVPSPTVGLGGAEMLALDPDAQRETARLALKAAADAVGLEEQDCSAPYGSAWQELIAEAQAEHATLVAIGSHGIGRALGVLVGSIATQVVHKATCSVLVARPAAPDFPRRIVVGVDGSLESARAYAAARHLAERFGATLWPVVAHGGGPVDAAAVTAILGHDREDLQDDPVHALLAAASEADLLVVGTRGLRGLRALGSVSERVSHDAHCSTLIVR